MAAGFLAIKMRIPPFYLLPGGYRIEEAKEPGT